MWDGVVYPEMYRKDFLITKNVLSLHLKPRSGVSVVGTVCTEAHHSFQCN